MMESAIAFFLDAGGRGEILFLCSVVLWVLIYMEIFDGFFTT